MIEAMKNYERWLEYKFLDEELRAELLSLKTEEEIQDRFYRNLEFGTGGLRGILGAGTNRMNIYTVRRTTQGFADYINEQFNKSNDRNKGTTPSVAIAYDSRKNSELFAKEAAKVLMGNQIKVYLYPNLMPTPALSYAVRYYKCNAGIMVTASHNPAKYNGYKVYNQEGCQMTLDAAAEVLNKIESIDIFHDIKLIDTLSNGNQNDDKYYNLGEKSTSMLEIIPDEVTDAFLAAVKQESTGVIGLENLSVVYTPLNGTGNLPVRKILSMIGVKYIELVKEQEHPDGNFPTCPYPNPEKEEALKLGLALCKELSDKVKNQAVEHEINNNNITNMVPDLLLATDPDCDRVGIAIWHRDESLETEDYHLLTGNQVGVLLLDYICHRRIHATHGAKPMPVNPIAIKTIVSSKMVEEVAKEYGVSILNVLTGFKFIGEQVGLLESKGEEDRFIFGFEESYGYLSGAYVRDKDAVNASMLICEMVAYYKLQGKTLIDKLNELYEKHGYYKEELLDFSFEGSVGMEKMESIMKCFREEPPTEVIGKRVVEIADYEISQRIILAQGNSSNFVTDILPINLPKSDVLECVLQDGSSFMIRPSGTEPKLKVYLSAKGGSLSDSEKIISELKQELTRLVLK